MKNEKQQATAALQYRKYIYLTQDGDFRFAF